MPSKKVVATSVLLAVALFGAVSAVSVDRIHNKAAAALDAGAEWDIWGGPSKDKVHESFAVNAVAQLATKAEKDQFSADGLKTGERWNDMPTGDKGDHLGAAPFLSDFFGHRGLTAATHFGCAQNWHSQAPAVKIPQTGVGAVVGGTWDLTFTNSDVKALIYATAKYWWGKVVSRKYKVKTENTKYDTERVKPGSAAKKLAAAAKKSRDRYHVLASWELGKIMHMVQDSYAPAHALRGYMVQPNPRTGPAADLSGCGDVLSFQGYPPQQKAHGHGSSDHMPKMTKTHEERVALYQCSQFATNALVAAFVACDPATATDCPFDTSIVPIFNHLFHLAPNVATQLAGGSVDELDIGGDKKQKVAGMVAAGYAQQHIQHFAVNPHWKISSKDPGPADQQVTTTLWVPDATVASNKPWSALFPNPLCGQTKVHWHKDAKWSKTGISAQSGVMRDGKDWYNPTWADVDGLRTHLNWDANGN